MPSHIRIRTVVLLSLLVAASLRADIQYRLTLAPEAETIKVTMTIPVKDKVTSLQIPNWAPGAYMKSGYYRNVQNVTATGPAGALTVDHPDNSTWSIPTSGLKQITVAYEINSAVAKTGRQVTGPSTYMYVVNRKLEKCKAEFVVPSDWKIATGLDTDGPSKFVAPTYDTFADAPVQVGVFNDDMTMVRGVPVHSITFGAAAADIDRKKLIDVCGQIVDQAAQLFGGLPYKRYFFFFSVFRGRDGGGGLEHLNSTSISLANALGPRSVWVIAHEHFHAWNVKRIRPFVLGPFDYIGYPQTHNLWWSEGVTDYYARMLDQRKGLMTQDEFIKDIADNIQQLQNNPAHSKVTADEASWRVFDANNSQGYGGLSYYLKGDMVGLCLDLKIRAATNGRRSLDDVMRSLYQQCKDSKPGFQEDAIRDLCIKMAGPQMGPFYDLLARSTEEMPFVEALASVGVKCDMAVKTATDFGCRFYGTSDNKGVELRGIAGAADKAGIQRGDMLVEVDGNVVPGAGETSEAAAKRLPLELKPGMEHKFIVMRDGNRMEIAITAGEKKSSTVTCTWMPDASDAQKKLRAGWLSGK